MSDTIHAGSINGYQCDKCGRITYVVHVDPGVTPMFLACRASGQPDCGTGTSLMYPRSTPPRGVVEAVAWEWYRPTMKWARRKGPEMEEHVRKGGLALRALTDSGRAVLPVSGGDEGNTP